MKNVLFITTHLGSGSSGLVQILQENPRVEVFNMLTRYEHPDHLDNLFMQGHKLGTSAAVYGDQLFFNIQLSSKVFYRLCKFIYVVREAKPSLNLIIEEQKYDVQRAFLYYTFRLRRICEMAKKTPGAVLLTWSDLAAGRGLPLLEEYLNLKIPLNPNPALFNRPDMDLIPLEIEEKAQACYERYLFYLKNLELRRPI